MKMRSLSYARGNPYLMITGLAILGSSIAFLFLIGVFVARMQVDAQSIIAIPKAFVYSTFVILLSSFSLQIANQNLKRERFRTGFQFMGITLALGLAFCILQVAGWLRLTELKTTFFKTYPSFILLFSGLHFVHIIVGIIGLSAVMAQSYKNRNYVDGYILALNPAKRTLLRMVSWFWHFLGVLWIGLFLMLLKYGMP